MKTTCKTFLTISVVASIVLIVTFFGNAILLQSQELNNPGSVTLPIGLFWILGVYAVLCLVFSTRSLKKFNRAFNKKELIPTAIISIFFSYVITGIFLLCLKDEDL